MQHIYPNNVADRSEQKVNENFTAFLFAFYDTGQCGVPTPQDLQE